MIKKYDDEDDDDIFLMSLRTSVRFMFLFLVLLPQLSVCVICISFGIARKYDEATAREHMTTSRKTKKTTNTTLSAVNLHTFTPTERLCTLYALMPVHGRIKRFLFDSIHLNDRKYKAFIPLASSYSSSSRAPHVFLLSFLLDFAVFRLRTD